jgi:hypothetical protein
MPEWLIFILAIVGVGVMFALMIFVIADLMVTLSRMFGQR